MWTFCSSWIGGHTCKVLPWSVQPFQRRCLKVKKQKQKIWLPNHVTDDTINFFLWTNLSLDDHQKFSFWLYVAFYLCNYDIIMKAPMMSSKNDTYSPWGILAMCQVSMFSWLRFQRYRGPKFFRLPIWLPHHVTYYIIIIIKTFYMSSRTYGENFCLYPTSGFGEKHESSVQTNKQTDKQANEKSIREWHLAK